MSNPDAHALLMATCPACNGVLVLPWSEKDIWPSILVNPATGKPVPAKGPKPAGATREPLCVSCIGRALKLNPAARTTYARWLSLHREELS